MLLQYAKLFLQKQYISFHHGVSSLYRMIPQVEVPWQHRLTLYGVTCAKKGKRLSRLRQMGWIEAEVAGENEREVGQSVIGIGFQKFGDGAMIKSHRKKSI